MCSWSSRVRQNEALTHMNSAFVIILKFQFVRCGMGVTQQQKIIWWWWWPCWGRWCRGWWMGSRFEWFAVLTLLGGRSRLFAKLTIRSRRMQGSWRGWRCDASHRLPWAESKQKRHKWLWSTQKKQKKSDNCWIMKPTEPDGKNSGGMLDSKSIINSLHDSWEENITSWKWAWLQMKNVAPNVQSANRIKIISLDRTAADWTRICRLKESGYTIRTWKTYFQRTTKWAANLQLKWRKWTKSKLPNVWPQVSIRGSFSLKSNWFEQKLHVRWANIASKCSWRWELWEVEAMFGWKPVSEEMSVYKKTSCGGNSKPEIAWNRNPNLLMKLLTSHHVKHIEFYSISFCESQRRWNWSYEMSKSIAWKFMEILHYSVSFNCQKYLRMLDQHSWQPFVSSLRSRYLLMSFFFVLFKKPSKSNLTKCSLALLVTFFFDLCVFNVKLQSVSFLVFRFLFKI